MGLRLKSFWARIRARLSKLWKPYTRTPLLGWLVAALVAALLEQLAGALLALILGMSKPPALFGLVIALKDPTLIPSAILYVGLIYVLPIGLVARFGAPLANKVAAKLLSYSVVVSALVRATP
jgi:branched-chain amino acid transport system permease protein